MNRRTFLKTGAAGLCGLALQGSAAAAARKLQVGVQQIGRAHV